MCARKTWSDDLGGKASQRAECGPGGHAGKEAISKRKKNPRPASDGISRCHKDCARGNNAGGGVIHLGWKVEQFGHLFSLGRILRVPTMNLTRLEGL